MELSMCGGAVRTFARAATCLARVGNELVLQASPDKLELHALSASRSAYQSVSFSNGFFDAYSVAGDAAGDVEPSPVQCSVLLKSVLSVLRTPANAIDRLEASLDSIEATKLRFTIYCLTGVRKTYWIGCNVEPEVQTLALDRQRFHSFLAARPRDLNRLLSFFQSSLQEITIIATEPLAGPLDARGEIGGKAVELRSYIDPAKDDTDSRLHTQLWVDPAEEFLEYVHAGQSVDVTFAVKELKAFITFCEACEADVKLYFEKAGEPILLVPNFATDDGLNPEFDATLVLATMLSSQLTEGSDILHPPAAANQRHEHARPVPVTPAAPENASNQTKIWSELSGSAAKCFEGNNEVHKEVIANASSQKSTQPHAMHLPQIRPTAKNPPDVRQPMEVDHLDEPRNVVNDNPQSQHHPSNWADSQDGEEDEDDELYVRSTPQYYD